MAYESEPGAYWAMLGPGVRLMRTPYDVEAAISGIRASGFPDPEELVGKYLLQRPDPGQASEFFERMATASERP